MSYTLPFLGQEVTVDIDRPLGSVHPQLGFSYPINCGYVLDTTDPDGIEISAYVLGVEEELDEFTGICIALVERLGDHDDKLVVAPQGLDVTEEDIRESIFFEEQFTNSVIHMAE